MQVAQRGDAEAAEPCLPLIRLVFGDPKTWLNSVHRGVSPRHLQAYLNEYTFRLNRPFYCFNAFHSLLNIVAETEPTTHETFYQGGGTPDCDGQAEGDTGVNRISMERPSARRRLS
jgi:hypothetical protein